MDSTNIPGYDITCGKCLQDCGVHLETTNMDIKTDSDLWSKMSVTPLLKKMKDPVTLLHYLHYSLNCLISQNLLNIFSGSCVEEKLLSPTQLCCLSKVEMFAQDTQDISQIYHYQPTFCSTGEIVNLHGEIGNGHEKMLGILCFTTVFLNILSNIDTDSFLMAL